jgi:hypothetical protein
MSYSSETEVSDDDYESLKQEFNEGKIVHRAEPARSEVVYSAIVVEEDNTDTLSDDFSPASAQKKHSTRAKKARKEEGFSEDEYYEQLYDEKYDEASFQDEYSDQGESVLVAQQVRNKSRKNHPDDKKVRKKGGEVVKRTRKFALPWTAAESKTLAMLVGLYGAKEWQFVAKILQSKHNNNRTAAQCSQRWCRVINPAINKGPWDIREDKLLCEKYEDLNGSWCKIVKFFPDRTDTQCKRRYEKLVQLRSRLQ